MTKKQRQNIIIDIIKKNNITTQEMLKNYLEDIDIEVTQATLSRDINELNLKKDSAGIYRYASVIENITECPAILKDSVADIVYAQNIVVIKCHTGMAQAACATIDKMKCTGIVGTLAGDDTIFVLMPNENSAVELCSILKNMIMYN
jgi:transcriptional regulator of arginine metabolism